MKYFPFKSTLAVIVAQMFLLMQFSYAFSDENGRQDYTTKAENILHSERLVSNEAILDYMWSAHSDPDNLSCLGATYPLRLPSVFSKEIRLALKQKLVTIPIARRKALSFKKILAGAAVVALFLVVGLLFYYVNHPEQLIKITSNYNDFSTYVTQLCGYNSELKTNVLNAVNDIKSSSFVGEHAQLAEMLGVAQEQVVNAGKQAAQFTHNIEPIISQVEQTRYIAASSEGVHSLAVGGIIGLLFVRARLQLKKLNVTPFNYFKSSPKFKHILAIAGLAVGVIVISLAMAGTVHAEGLIDSTQTMSQQSVQTSGSFLALALGLLSGIFFPIVMHEFGHCLGAAFAGCKKIAVGVAETHGAPNVSTIFIDDWKNRKNPMLDMVKIDLGGPLMNVVLTLVSVVTLVNYGMLDWIEIVDTTKQGIAWFNVMHVVMGGIGAIGTLTYEGFFKNTGFRLLVDYLKMRKSANLKTEKGKEKFTQQQRKYYKKHFNTTVTIDNYKEKMRSVVLFDLDITRLMYAIKWLILLPISILKTPYLIFTQFRRLPRKWKIIVGISVLVLLSSTLFYIFGGIEYINEHLLTMHKSIGQPTDLTKGTPIAAGVIGAVSSKNKSKEIKKYGPKQFFSQIKSNILNLKFDTIFALSKKSLKYYFYTLLPLAIISQLLDIPFIFVIAGLVVFYYRLKIKILTVNAYKATVSYSIERLPAIWTKIKSGWNDFIGSFQFDDGTELSEKEIKAVEKDIKKFSTQTEEEQKGKEDEKEDELESIVYPKAIGITNLSKAFALAKTGTPQNALSVTELVEEHSLSEFLNKIFYDERDDTLWEVINIEEASTDEQKFESTLLLKNVSNPRTKRRISFSDEEEPYISIMNSYVVLKEGCQDLNANTVDFELNLRKLVTIKEYYSDQLKDKNLSPFDFIRIHNTIVSLSQKMEEMQIAWFLSSRGMDIDVRSPPSLNELVDELVGGEFMPQSDWKLTLSETELKTLEFIESLYQNRLSLFLSLPYLEDTEEKIKVRIAQIDEKEEQIEAARHEKEKQEFVIRNLEETLKRLDKQLQKDAGAKEVLSKKKTIQEQKGKEQEKLEKINQNIAEAREDTTEEAALSYSLGSRKHETFYSERRRLKVFLRETEDEIKQIQHIKTTQADIEDRRLELYIWDMINLQLDAFNGFGRTDLIKSIRISGDSIFIDFKTKRKTQEFQLFDIFEKLMETSPVSLPEIAYDFISYYRHTRLNGYQNKAHARYKAFVDLKNSATLLPSPHMDILFAQDSLHNGTEVFGLTQLANRLKLAFGGLAPDEFSNKMWQDEERLEHVYEQIKITEQKHRSAEKVYFQLINENRTHIDINIHTVLSNLTGQLKSLKAEAELLERQVKNNEKLWIDNKLRVARLLSLKQMQNIRQIARMQRLGEKIDAFFVEAEWENSSKIVTDLLKTNSIRGLITNKDSIDELITLYERYKEEIEFKIEIAYKEHGIKKEGMLRVDMTQTIEQLNGELEKLNELLAHCERVKEGIFAPDKKPTFMGHIRSKEVAGIKLAPAAGLALYCASAFSFMPAQAVAHQQTLYLEPFLNSALGKTGDVISTVISAPFVGSYYAAEEIRDVLLIPKDVPFTIGGLLRSLAEYVGIGGGINMPWLNQKLSKWSKGGIVFTDREYSPSVVSESRRAARDAAEQGKEIVMLSFNPTGHWQTDYWKGTSFDEFDGIQMFHSDKTFPIEKNITFENKDGRLKINMPIQKRKPLFRKNKYAILLPQNAVVDSNAVRFDKERDVIIASEGPTIIIEGNFTKGDTLYFEADIYGSPKTDHKPGNAFTSHYTENPPITWSEESQAFMRDVGEDPNISYEDKIKHTAAFVGSKITWSTEEEVAKFYRKFYLINTPFIGWILKLFTKAPHYDNLVEAALGFGKGDCDVINTVFICMLRDMGIPARLVTGFAFGGAKTSSGNGLISADTGHGWCEVFVPGKGWVAYDAVGYAAIEGEPQFDGLLRTSPDTDDDHSFDWQYNDMSEDMNKQMPEMPLEESNSNDIIDDALESLRGRDDVDVDGLLKSSQPVSDAVFFQLEGMSDDIDSILQDPLFENEDDPDAARRDACKFNQTAQWVEAIVDSLLNSDVTVGYNNLMDILNAVNGDISKIARATNLSPDDPNALLFKKVTRLVYEKLEKGQIVKEEKASQSSEEPAQPKAPDVSDINVDQELLDKYDIDIMEQIKEATIFLKSVEDTFADKISPTLSEIIEQKGIHINTSGDFAGEYLGPFEIKNIEKYDWFRVTIMYAIYQQAISYKDIQHLFNDTYYGDKHYWAFHEWTAHHLSRWVAEDAMRILLGLDLQYRKEDPKGKKRIALLEKYIFGHNISDIQKTGKQKLIELALPSIMDDIDAQLRSNKSASDNMNNINLAVSMVRKIAPDHVLKAFENETITIFWWPPQGTPQKYYGTAALSSLEEAKASWFNETLLNFGKQAWGIAMSEIKSEFAARKFPNPDASASMYIYDKVYKNVPDTMEGAIRVGWGRADYVLACDYASIIATGDIDLSVWDKNADMRRELFEKYVFKMPLSELNKLLKDERKNIPQTQTAEQSPEASVEQDLKTKYPNIIFDDSIFENRVVIENIAYVLEKFSTYFKFVPMELSCEAMTNQTVYRVFYHTGNEFGKYFVSADDKEPGKLLESIGRYIYFFVLTDEQRTQFNNLDPISSSEDPHLLFQAYFYYEVSGQSLTRTESYWGDVQQFFENNVLDIKEDDIQLKPAIIEKMKELIKAKQNSEQVTKKQVKWQEAVEKKYNVKLNDSENPGGFSDSKVQTIVIDILEKINKYFPNTDVILEIKLNKDYITWLPISVQGAGIATFYNERKVDIDSTVRRILRMIGNEIIDNRILSEKQSNKYYDACGGRGTFGDDFADILMGNESEVSDFLKKLNMLIDLGVLDEDQPKIKNQMLNGIKLYIEGVKEYNKNTTEISLEQLKQKYNYIVFDDQIKSGMFNDNRVLVTLNAILNKLDKYCSGVEVVGACETSANNQILIGIIGGSRGYEVIINFDFAHIHIDEIGDGLIRSLGSHVWSLLTPDQQKYYIDMLGPEDKGRTPALFGENVKQLLMGGEIRGTKTKQVLRFFDENIFDISVRIGLEKESREFKPEIVEKLNKLLEEKRKEAKEKTTAEALPDKQEGPREINANERDDILYEVVKLFKPYFADDADRNRMLDRFKKYLTDIDGRFESVNDGLIELTPDEAKNETVEVLKSIIDEIASRYRKQDKNAYERLGLYYNLIAPFKGEIQLHGIKHLLAYNLTFDELKTLDVEQTEGMELAFLFNLMAVSGNLESMIEISNLQAHDEVFGMYLWTENMLNNMRNNADFVNSRWNKIRDKVNLELLNKRLLACEANFVEMIYLENDIGEINLQLDRLISKYTGQLKNPQNKNFIVDLDVLNCSPRYFAKGAENIVNLATGFFSSPVELQPKLINLFTEGIERLQDSPTDEEIGFYSTMLSMLMSRVEGGKYQQECISIFLNLFEDANEQTAGVLAEAIANNADRDGLIFVTGKILGEYPHLLSDELLKIVFRRFLNDKQVLSEIAPVVTDKQDGQQKDMFREIVRQGAERIGNFDFSNTENVSIAIGLLELAVGDAASRNWGNLDVDNLIENIDITLLDKDEQLDAVEKLSWVVAEIRQAIGAINEIGALNDGEKRIADLKTWRFNILKKILPALKEQKNWEFNKKYFQLDAGLTIEEIKKLGLAEDFVIENFEKTVEQKQKELLESQKSIKKKTDEQLKKKQMKQQLQKQLNKLKEQGEKTKKLLEEADKTLNELKEIESNQQTDESGSILGGLAEVAVDDFQQLGKDLQNALGDGLINQTPDIFNTRFGPVSFYVIGIGLPHLNEQLNAAGGIMHTTETIFVSLERYQEIENSEDMLALAKFEEDLSHETEEQLRAGVNTLFDKDSTPHDAHTDTVLAIKASEESVLPTKSTEKLISNKPAAYIPTAHESDNIAGDGAAIDGWRVDNTRKMPRQAQKIDVLSLIKRDNEKRGGARNKAQQQEILDASTSLNMTIQSMIELNYIPDDLIIFNQIDIELWKYNNKILFNWIKENYIKADQNQIPVLELMRQISSILYETYLKNQSIVPCAKFTIPITISIDADTFIRKGVVTSDMLQDIKKSLEGANIRFVFRVNNLKERKILTELGIPDDMIKSNNEILAGMELKLDSLEKDFLTVGDQTIVLPLKELKKDEVINLVISINQVIEILNAISVNHTGDIKKLQAALINAFKRNYPHGNLPVGFSVKESLEIIRLLQLSGNQI